MNSSDYKIYSTSQEAWDGMYQAILGAEKSIYWELYIFLDDEVGTRFFDVLEEKTKAGVDVKVIVDSFGSFWLSRKRVKSLKKAGVDLRFFHERKFRYRGWWKRIWSRTHRKILVVDEHIGFIGGVNIQKHMKNWLDIHIRLEGVVVHSLLRSFAKSYLICGGEKEEIKHLLKYKFRVEHNELDFIYDDSHDNVSKARKKYTEALLKARERIILFSPYYFPDKKFIKALWAARKRGVKIDLLIPFRSDVRIATYAAYAVFSILRKIGVNIHLSKEMMHGKGIIVDDNWAMIGSSNLTHESFYDHYEANVELKDKNVIERLKQTVGVWLNKSITLEDFRWSERGRWMKFKEWISIRLYRLWHRRRVE